MATSTCCNVGCDTDTFMCSGCHDHCGYLVEFPTEKYLTPVWEEIKKRFNTSGGVIEVWSHDEEEQIKKLFAEHNIDWNTEL